MKKSPNLFLILVWSFVILPSLVSAQEKDLIINGDYVSFDQERNIVEAKGSVEAVYKDVVIHGHHIIYDTETEIIRAEQGFDFTYLGISIEGETLDYAIKKKEGWATDVDFIYQGVLLGGEKIEFGDEKLSLRNAYFTTCDLNDYHVSASEIVLYPKHGWLVAYWGWFWLSRFPLVPVPTYIYDVFAHERGRRNLPPFPEIGANDEDGTYIHQKLAWHARREFSGTYTISYADQKGWGGGVEADYIVRENSQGNMRLYGNGVDGLWGGITHRLFFGGEIGEENNLPFAFLALPKHHQYEFDATLSYRERINYQKVSYYPNLVLKAKEGQIFRKEAKYDAEVGLGVVAEENNVRLARGLGIFDVYWDFPETNLGDITPILGLDTRFYSNGAKWIRNTGRLELEKNFARDVSLGLGYLHYFSIQGQSPFKFEKYRFSPADRFKSNLLFKIRDTGVGIATSYFLDTGQPEDIDYSLFFSFHCYNLEVKYRSIRREFSLGFSLAGGY